MKTSCIAALGALAATLLASSGAHALPAYSQREGKTCLYCHTTPSGGKTTVNYRAKFYKEHSLTFAGFDDAAEAKKAGVEIGPEPTPPPKSYTPPKGQETKEEEPKPAAPMTEDNESAVVEDEKPEQPEKPKVSAVLLAARAKVQSTEAALKNEPRNPARKRAYAAALTQLGYLTMNNRDAMPRQKYPEALGLFRKALAMDPKNKTARAHMKQIVAIYKKMGRPVPK